MSRQASRPDPLTTEQRRLNMSRIKGSDTKPEMLVRKGLHSLGFRYRLHGKGLPGKPDLVFSSSRAVVFVHGCFWHRHSCSLGVLPRSNAAFWDAKLAANKERDETNERRLIAAGWRVATVWECALRGPARLPVEQVLKRLANFVQGNATSLMLRGATAIL